MSPEARTAGALPTRYEPDELALGACLAISVLHALPVALLAFGVAFPTRDEPVREQPKPVIAAALLKLGKPIDPKRLPDRAVACRDGTAQGGRRVARRA